MSYWNDSALNHYLDGGAQVKRHAKGKGKKKASPRSKCTSWKRLISAKKGSPARKDVYCRREKGKPTERLTYRDAMQWERNRVHQHKHAKLRREKAKARRASSPRCVSRKALSASPAGSRNRFCTGSKKAGNRRMYSKEQLAKHDAKRAHARSRSSGARSRSKAGAQALRDLRADCKKRNISAQQCRRMAFKKRIGYYGDREELKEGKVSFKRKDIVVRNGKYLSAAALHRRSKAGKKRIQPLGMRAWGAAMKIARVVYGNRGLIVSEYVLNMKNEEVISEEYKLVSAFRDELMDQLESVKGNLAAENKMIAAFVRANTSKSSTPALLAAKAAAKRVSPKRKSPKRVSPKRVSSKCADARAKLDKARTKKQKKSWSMKARMACK